MGEILNIVERQEAYLSPTFELKAIEYEGQQACKVARLTCSGVMVK